MARAEVRTVILFEDREQETFLRHLAKRLNLRPVRFENCGNNAGVLQRVGREVDALRERNFQRNLGLIVAIDADDSSHVRRVQELLNRIAQDCRGGTRQASERIGLVVPAWEIETWYVHLCIPGSRPIDQGKDYKMTAEWRRLEKDIGTSAKIAAEAWQPEAGRGDPPSLVASRDELARLS